MPTETVADRERAGRFVGWTIKTQGPRIAVILAAEFAPFGVDGAVTDFWLLQQNLLLMLDDALEKLIAADQAYVDELADDAEPRARRDQAGEKLHAALFSMRGICDLTYVPDNIETLGFPKMMTRDNSLMLSQGKRAYSKLNNPEMPMPKAQFEGVEIPPAVLANALKPIIDAVEQALNDVDREHKEAEIVRLHRNRAIEHFDHIFLWVARTLESLYSLAGEIEAAQRVRPSVRRPGRTAEPISDDEAEEAGASPGPPTPEPDDDNLPPPSPPQPSPAGSPPPPGPGDSTAPDSPPPASSDPPAGPSSSTASDPAGN